MTPVRLLTSLLFEYRRKIFLALSGSLVTAIGLLLIPASLKAFMERALAGNLDGNVLPIIAGLLGGLALITCVSYGSYYIMFNVANLVTADIRIRYVDRLLALPLATHRNKQSGEILDPLLTGLADIHRFIRSSILAAVFIPILLGGALVMIFLLHWQLALIVVVLIPLLSISLRAFFLRARIAMKESAVEQGTLTAYIQSLLLGIDVVKAFNAQAFEHDRFTQRQKKTLSLLRKEAGYVALLEPLIVSASIGTCIIVLTYGGWQLSTGSLRPDTLITFLLYTMVLIPQSRVISVVYLSWQQFGNAMERLDEILALPEEKDQPGATPLPARINGAISVSDISYGYPHRGRALEGLSFSIAPKECVGIVGESGAGKTTLFNLLMRLYTPDSGSISIDGNNIQHLTLQSLRNTIAVVPQDTVLFEGTILDNVRYGRPHAEDDEVHAACRAAQMEEFIAGLPQHYDTVVGERGVKLSGGQRQRIAIARALLKDAPIVLMDEATSSLDAHTELLLRSAMETAMLNRTTLIIAHRLATVVHLPRILVLHHGKVLDEGSHEVLFQRCEVYRTLVSTQLIAPAEPLVVVDRKELAITPPQLARTLL